MIANTHKNSTEPKLGQTLMQDIRQSDFRSTLRREWNELKDFFLDHDRQNRLREMSKLKRWFVVFWWLLKSLFFKLSPMRRILLVISIFIIAQSGSINLEAENIHIGNDFNKIGFVVLLFILMLELKDKLIAQSELQAGRSVQRALMPERSPLAPGWELWLFTRPANEVGGDWVDYLEIEKDRFGITLGDVAGKGLKAALLMAKLQSTLRALAADFRSLSDLVAKLNRIYRRDGLSDSFASMVYLELQGGSGHVRLVNAGHLPPILLKGGKIEELQQRAAALGVLPEANFIEQHFELQHGDVLLIYSDGLNEAVNEANEFFGEQRLLALFPKLASLSAPKIGDRIVAEVDRFIGQAKAHDDLSLVILKRVANE